jgi:hypothetical protein
MSKIILSSLAIFFSINLHASDLELEGNLLSKEQISNLNAHMSEWVGEQAKKQSVSHDQYLKLASNDQDVLNAMVKETNKVLSEMKAPTIGKVKSNQYKIAQENGFAGSTIKGVSFLDGKHVFCFPCETGYNNFSYGVFAGKKLKIPSVSGGVFQLEKKHVGKPVPIEGSPDPK